MATAAKMPETGGGEYKRPDAEAAFKIYEREIAPKKSVIAEKTGDLSDPYSRIKDQCNYPRRILDLVVYLAGLEDAKRDHMLLALSEGLKVKKLFMPRDLATMAQGNDGDGIVASAPRAKPQLVAMGIPSDGSETDLADAAGDDPDPGTGAAAIAAMNESSDDLGESQEAEEAPAE